jgi:alpha-1,6-mannosyltransferase
VWIGPLLLAPPLFTRDIFSYLAQGALPLHGFDPYAVGPDAMPGILTDNVHYFWQDTPAPYGPLFIIIAKTVAWLVGNNIIAGVLLMRLALLPGLALLVWALPELTRRLGGRVPVALWVAVANPMMVINMIGGGHNDLLVVGLLAAGALLALRGQHAAGIGLVTLAMAVKASAGLALPFLVLVWAAHMTGSRWVRIGKATAAGIGVFAVVFAACTLLARVSLGWLPALSAPSMIVNWMSLPTAIGQIVGWFASLFGGSQQLFINIFRGIGAAVLLWIAVRQWWAARDPARGHRAARHLGPLPRHAPVVRELGHGLPGDGAVDRARPAVPGRRVDHAGHRLLPQRRGRPLQLGLPRGVPGGGAARRLVAGEARSAAARGGRAQQAAARRGATGEACRRDRGGR